MSNVTPLVSGFFFGLLNRVQKPRSLTQSACNQENKTSPASSPRRWLRRHLGPEFPYLASWIGFDSGVGVEHHRRASRSVVSRPARNARVIRITSIRKRNPHRSEPVAHHFAFRGTNADDCIPHPVERSSYIRAVDSAELAAETRALPRPQIHVSRSLAERRLAFRLRDG